MNLSVDIIFLLAGIFFFLAGLSKGFLKTIIGPLALVLGTGMGFMYYQKTGDWAAAFVISFFGPITIKVGFWLFRAMLPTPKPEEQRALTLGKIAGGVFNLLWGWGIMAIIIMFLTMIPGEWIWLKKVQTNILQSNTYAWINKQTHYIFQKGRDNILSVLTFWTTPGQSAKMAEMPEYQELIEQDKVQTILDDENLLLKLQDHNPLTALRDPKIQALIKDKDLVKQILNLQMKMINSPQKSVTVEPPSIDAQTNP
jgi:uncharacterized membrane protein required for colicin V production